MLKSYEVTVTYRVYADDETEATGQVVSDRVSPVTVDVYALPTRQYTEIEIAPF